jgi:hypothetical protein
VTKINQNNVITQSGWELVQTGKKAITIIKSQVKKLWQRRKPDCTLKDIANKL